METPENRLTIEVPRLETERCVMRAHRLEDFEDLAEMWSDLAVTRHITGIPSSRQEAWARLLRYFGQWCALRFGYWVVADRQTGEFLGEVGFADYRRDIEPSLDGIPEIGWVLRSSAHGRGLATETVVAALGWGDVNLASDRTVCIVDPHHNASIRVAEKTGYCEFARTTYSGEPALLLDRVRGT